MTDKKLAPYPASSADATADNLAAHLAVAAQRLYLKNMDAADLDRTAMSLFVQEWAVVFLLREVQERAGTHIADALARELWEAWGDGSHLGECLWEWLTEYGISPEEITR
jgi:hypothetical protein